MRCAHLVPGGATLAILAAFVAVDHLAIHPAGSVPWRGPAPGGTWVRTALTLQTNALVVASEPLGGLVAGTGDGAWRSGDGGVHWVRDGTGLRGQGVVSLAAAPGGDLLLAGTDGGAVYALDPSAARRGGSWRRVSPSLDATPVYSLAVAPECAGTVLAGTVGALYRGTVTAGRWRWRRVARTGQAAITSIAWSPTDARRALASVFGIWPPILATRDGGRTWHAADAGLPAALPTQALLAFVPANPTGSRQPQIPRALPVMLTTMGGGVWERAATGRWRDVSAGLPARHAMPLVALPGRGAPVLYAGTMGDGVYVKQGSAAWRLLAPGLMGVDKTVLALGISTGPHPSLVAGTAAGVFRYVAAR